LFCQAGAAVSAVVESPGFDPRNFLWSVLCDEWKIETRVDLIRLPWLLAYGQHRRGSTARGMLTLYPHSVFARFLISSDSLGQLPNFFGQFCATCKAICTLVSRAVRIRSDQRIGLPPRGLFPSTLPVPTIFSRSPHALLAM
ncbi:jg25475, partial [Pararge aegeria aegeria]